ncbi:putative DNA-3-methyladenine glycosylase [Quillaja saponaria]|uniref:DNA-3-methyladenine glycosylase n=1 Tax=Quillaja saponaria TaxID=32244 RepID=A0AAD7L605_QUISA|nr:putative DNA-3-methyladenine glycosylase [Quillaja saponaria]
MSGRPRVRSMNVAETESRPVLVPAGNKVRTIETRITASKPVKKTQNALQETESKEKNPIVHSTPQCVSVPMILKQQDHPLRSFSMNASCSSDASSTDSSTHSRASSSGRLARRVDVPVRKKQSGSKTEKVEKVGTDNVAAPDTVLTGSIYSLEAKKRCGWVTPKTDLRYSAFHDEEWGVPVHDDKKLFELLSLSGALAELTWPVILSKRQIFREVFLDFDPKVVSQLNEKKITLPGSPASFLLTDLKLRGIIENARQMCKVINEFGSFDAFIWNFVNHKPIVSQFRYPRQVPVKSPKAEVISKDLIRRGFRSVGPTVIYTFMQVAGLTNDHLISCFRLKECMARSEAGGRRQHPQVFRWRR